MNISKDSYAVRYAIVPNTVIDGREHAEKTKPIPVLCGQLIASRALHFEDVYYL
jgi:hypothetical protein